MRQNPLEGVWRGVAAAAVASSRVQNTSAFVRRTALAPRAAVPPAKAEALTAARASQMAGPSLTQRAVALSTLRCPHRPRPRCPRGRRLALGPHAYDQRPPAGLLSVTNPAAALAGAPTCSARCLNGGTGPGARGTAPGGACRQLAKQLQADGCGYAGSPAMVRTCAGLPMAMDRMQDRGGVRDAVASRGRIVDILFVPPNSNLSIGGVSVINAVCRLLYIAAKY